MPSTWPDYADLGTAIEGIDTVVRQANESKRIMDNDMKIKTIRESLIDFVGRVTGHPYEGGLM